MSIEVKVPVLPESVTDATIASWHKKAGDAVKRDENLVDLETDKVVLEVPSPTDGVLKEIKAQVGDTVTSAQVIAVIEPGAAAAKDDGKTAAKDDAKPKAEPKAEPRDAGQAAAPAKAQAAPAKSSAAPPKSSGGELSPAANRVAAEAKLDPAAIEGTGRGGRVTKEDAVAAAARPPAAAAGARTEQRVPMTRIRQRIAERMMQSKNSIAMLTSFNEVNMKAVMGLRKQLGEAFEKTHGVRLGIMSFFVSAAAQALRRHPAVNASVDGTDIIYHAYADISIAVATERGLMTPVLRNAETLGFAEIERAIGDYATKARDGGLTLDDLQGGTFTITNGGVFGSLLSTPIVNPPQSAILGMHTIKERAIVEGGQVIAAPMMYIALSYDHRVIDGKDAVTFLVDIKDQLENPAKMLFGI